MFFIVGVTETCKRLAVCNTGTAASAYVETLPGHEDGIYYIDVCDDTVTLGELSPDDLPANVRLESIHD